MTSERVFRITLIALSVFALDLPGATERERSVSPSGQFIVYGGDAAWRGPISTLAERVKTSLLAVLQRPDQWKTSVVINLQRRAANLPEVPNTAFRFSQTGSGLKLQLDLTISREMNSAAIEREILRVIVLEMIYRNQTGISPGETYVDPPDWLLDGLLALAPNRDRAPLTDALATAGRAPSLDEFLRERPELLDSAGRSLYRAYSFALVQLLAENPAQLRRYIDNLAFSGNDPIAELRKNFPRLSGGDREKIWESKIARVMAPTGTDLLTYAQTEQKLDALLETKFPASRGAEKSSSLEDLCQQKLSSPQQLALNKFEEKLLLLAAHANPALRPVIQDYHQLAAELALGKSRGVATRLGGLKNLRTRLSARMSEIDDYLNWFEATQLNTASGLFENPSGSPDNVAAHPRRKDAFSTYLDAMESQF